MLRTGDHVPKSTQTYSRSTRDAAAVLGAQITSLEGGTPTVAMGTAFEAAAVLGVPLFGADAAGLATLAARQREVLALLPRRVVGPRAPVRDDF